MHRMISTAALFTLVASAHSNEAHNRLSALDEGKQKYALAHVIRSAGEDCRRVTRVFFQGIEKKTQMAMWHARCDNNKSFVVSLANDRVGSTGVLDCAVLKAFAHMDCFKKY
jgi:hypothetical protein